MKTLLAKECADTVRHGENSGEAVSTTFRQKFLGKTTLPLMLLVANLANTIWCKRPKQWLKPWRLGTHQRVLSKSYPMNTNMTGYRCFFKYLRALDESSLSIGRITKTFALLWTVWCYVGHWFFCTWSYGWLIHPSMIQPGYLSDKKASFWKYLKRENSIHNQTTTFLQICTL